MRREGSPWRGLSVVFFRELFDHLTSARMLVLQLLVILFGGMVVTLLPQVIGLFFGHFVLRMNPILLLGALTGAQTATAAMAAVQERSGSPVAVLGYTPAYPVANILLTTWGAIIVLGLAG